MQVKRMLDRRLSAQKKNMFNINTKYNKNCKTNIKKVIDEIKQYLFDNNEMYISYNENYNISDLLNDTIDITTVANNFSAGINICELIYKQISDTENFMNEFNGALDEIIIKSIENKLELLDYIIFDIRSYITKNETIIFKNQILRSRVQRTKTIHSRQIIDTALNLLLDKNKNDFFESIPISLFLIRQYMDIRIKELLFGRDHNTSNKIDIKPGLKRLEKEGRISNLECQNLSKILKITNDYAHHGILPYYWIAYESGKYTKEVMSKINV